MAQHPDDRSSTPADDRLQSLYRRRKAAHRVPEDLNRAVLEKARVHRRPSGRRQARWTRIVPPVAAAFVAMALGLQWLRDPADTVLQEMASSPAPAETAESMATPDTSGLARRESPPPQAKSRSEDRPAATAERQPSAFGESEESSVLGDAAADRIMAEPMPAPSQAADQVDATDLSDRHPRYLRAVPGEPEVFERCDGSRYERAIDQTPAEGWFELTWSGEGRLERVRPLTESPCDRLTD